MMTQIITDYENLQSRLRAIVDAAVKRYIF